LFFDFLKLSDAAPEEDTTTFSVPPAARSYVRTSDMNEEGVFGTHVFSGDGWIVHMGAHLHAWEGGKKVDVFLNGKLLTRYRSFLADRRVPWSWRTNVGPFYARVHRGDVLTISATYENTEDEPIRGAMGMLGVFFVQDRFSLEAPLYQFVWRARSVAYPALQAFGVRFKE
jgi:hypothetical protein